MALELVTKFETFDDQKITACPFSTTRFPSLDIVRIPEESLSGFCLLATHMTVEYRNIIIPDSEVAIGRIFRAEES